MDSLSSLLNAIETNEQAATRSSELHNERTQALNYYLGKPFGNEVEGRSQVVSHDVSDTIEWIKPSLMRIFASGDEIVAFDPKGPEDVEQAQQESDFCNHILTQKNNWFRTSYVWFTDALMQKNAYVKAWWDEDTDVTVEKYEGLTPEQLMMLKQDPEVEIVEEVGYEDPSFNLTPEMIAQAQLAGQPVPTAPLLFNVDCQRTTVYGCVKYKEIPPERTVVSQWASSIDLEDVDFFEHFEWKTLSDIRAMHLEVPENFGDEGMSDFSESEEQARNLYGEPFDETTDDESQKRYKLREIWIRFDDDEDGIAELLHVFVLGRSILKNKKTGKDREPVEFIPAAAITPRMMPHRHVGRSIADEVEDIQLIKSTLLRGTLDNMYLGNNGRYGVDEQKVNLDDMLTSRPGGLVRTQGSPHDKILPFVHPNLMGQGLQAIEYMDNLKQNRTGVTAYVTSVDENVLNKTASGTSMLQNAAMAKIELIARVFAETGVKRLMWLIHAISLKHARKAEIVRLRNKFVNVDPRQWKSRWDMTVSVGLGTGNKEQQLIHLQMIMALQEKLLPLGMVTKKNVRHSSSKFIQAAGFKDDESFVAPPSEQDQAEDQPIQLNQPDPSAMEQVKQQGENQRAMLQVQADGQKTAFEAQNEKELEAIRQAEETNRVRLKIESEERIALAKIASEERKVQFNAQQAAQRTGAEIAARAASRQPQ